MSECAPYYLTLNKFAIELCPLIKALRDTKTHFSKVLEPSVKVEKHNHFF